MRHDYGVTTTISYVLLVTHTLINRHQNIERLRGMGEQFAILDARPFAFLCGADRELRVSRDLSQRHPTSFFDKRHRLFARHCRIVVQELLERLAAFEIIQQNPDGYTFSPHLPPVLPPAAAIDSARDVRHIVL